MGVAVGISRDIARVNEMQSDLHGCLSGPRKMFNWCGRQVLQFKTGKETAYVQRSRLKAVVNQPTAHRHKIRGVICHVRNDQVGNLGPDPCLP